MIGLLYQQKEELTKAEEILIKAQQEFEDGVAFVLRDRARVALEAKDLEKAEGLIKQSINLLSNSTQKGHLGISQVQLAKILTQKGNVVAAELIKDSIKLLHQSPNRFFEPSAYFNLAQVQNQAGKKEEAKQMAEKSLEILNSITNKNQHKKLKEERLKFLKEITLS